MKIRFLLLSLLIWTYSSINAKIVMPGFIADNMVLQQSSLVKLWGKARINSFINIKCSWNNKTFTTKSDSKGDWNIKITTPKGNYTPQSLTISDGTTLKIKNILIGEVWLCAGQSNMDITLNGYTSCPIMGTNETILNAEQYKGIRCFTVKQHGSSIPLDSCGGQWLQSNSKNAPTFSAVGYHFATTLNKFFDIPIGIIVCAWPGTTVEGWSPEQIVKNYPEYNPLKPDKREWRRPTIMYNGMLHPIEGYTIKGIVWYQGESNVEKYSSYADRLTNMIKTWRDEWGEGNIPFYIVEIAPYQRNDEKSPYLREAQSKVASSIPNSGIVCTNDCVEPYESSQVHPKNKTDIGKRLGLLALQNTYGVEGIQSFSPVYKSIEIKNNKIILSFDNVKGGFTFGTGLIGFEIAGADKKFYPAVANTVQGTKIEVSSSYVTNPVAVRYCFHDFQLGNVKCARELPLLPFRTDNW